MEACHPSPSSSEADMEGVLYPLVTGIACLGHREGWWVLGQAHIRRTVIRQVGRNCPNAGRNTGSATGSGLGTDTCVAPPHWRRLRSGGFRDKRSVAQLPLRLCRLQTRSSHAEAGLAVSRMLMQHGNSGSLGLI